VFVIADSYSFGLEPADFINRKFMEQDKSYKCLLNVIYR